MKAAERRRLCPACGGPMSRRAARCGGCRYPLTSTRHRYDVCACGATKRVVSQQCLPCSRATATVTKARPCAGCGQSHAGRPHKRTGEAAEAAGLDALAGPLRMVTHWRLACVLCARERWLSVPALRVDGRWQVPVPQPGPCPHCQSRLVSLERCA